MLVLQKSEYKTSDYINVIDSLRYFLGEIRVLLLWKDHRAMSDNPSLLKCFTETKHLETKLQMSIFRREL